MPGDGPVAPDVLRRAAGAPLLWGGSSQLGAGERAPREATRQRLPTQAGRGECENPRNYGQQESCVSPTLQNVCSVLRLHISFNLLGLLYCLVVAFSTLCLSLGSVLASVTKQQHLPCARCEETSEA